MANLTKVQLVDGLIKDFPEVLEEMSKQDLENMTKNDLREIRIRLLTAREHAKETVETEETVDTETEETVETKQEEEEVVITEEMITLYKDESSELYCGVFSNPDLNSPICSKDCQELYSERFIMCNAMAAQKEAEKAKVVQRSKRNGNGKRSEIKDWIVSTIAEGKYTRKQIGDMFVQAFPERAISTATTYISDGVSRKYCPFDRYVHIDKETKIVSFSDEKAPGSRKKSEELYAAKK